MRDETASNALTRRAASPDWPRGKSGCEEKPPLIPWDLARGATPCRGRHSPTNSMLGCNHPPDNDIRRLRSGRWPPWRDSSINAVGQSGLRIDAGMGTGLGLFCKQPAYQTSASGECSAIVRGGPARSTSGDVAPVNVRAFQSVGPAGSLAIAVATTSYASHQAAGIR